MSKNSFQRQIFGSPLAICFRGKLVPSVVLAVALLRIPYAVGQETLTAVVPPSAANEEGRGSAIPFCCGGSHVQFLYDAGNFAASMPQGGTITEISFRTDGPNGRVADETIPDIEIFMFTTKVHAEDVEKGYRLPHGPDRTLVFRRGPLHLKSAWSSEILNPFQLKIPLSQPFRYCPDSGNLVIEIVQYEAGSGLRLDISNERSTVELNGSPFTASPALAIQLSFIQEGSECLRAFIMRNGRMITLSGSMGGTIQAMDSLSVSNWIDIGPAPQVLGITNALRFFRIRKDTM